MELACFCGTRMGEELDNGQELTDAQLLDARAARYARALEPERTVLLAAVTFRRGASAYALPLLGLKEIRALSRWCVMPGASAVVPGVVHSRGDLLSLHDVAFFTGGESQQGRACWVLIAEHRGRRLGLMADDVMDVVELEAGAVQATPVGLGEAAELFLGMTRGGVLILECARMFEISRFARAY